MALSVLLVASLLGFAPGCGAEDTLKLIEYGCGRDLAYEIFPLGDRVELELSHIPDGLTENDYEATVTGKAVLTNDGFAFTGVSAGESKVVFSAMLNGNIYQECFGIIVYSDQDLGEPAAFMMKGARFQNYSQEFIPMRIGKREFSVFFDAPWRETKYAQTNLPWSWTPIVDDVPFTWKSSNEEILTVTKAKNNGFPVPGPVGVFTSVNLKQAGEATISLDLFGGDDFFWDENLANFNVKVFDTSRDIAAELEYLKVAIEFYSQSENLAQSGTPEYINFMQNTMSKEGFRSKKPSEKEAARMGTKPTGKYAVLATDDRLQLDLMAGLPPKVLPDTLEEVRYVIKTSYSYVYIATYYEKGGSGVRRGYRTDKTVSIIDLKTGKTLKEYGTIKGYDPGTNFPGEKSGDTSDYHAKPDESDRDKALIRKAILEVWEL